MRFVFTVFLLAFAATTLHSAELKFVRVWPGWQSAASFDRISEYFDGKENTGRHTMIRTQPNARAGFYFLVRLEKSTRAPAGSKFVLNLISPSAPQAKTYTFPVAPDSSFIFELGLTGSDWPNEATHPVAWKLELVSADGVSLVSTQSFLWAMPAP